MKTTLPYVTQAVMWASIPRRYLQSEYYFLVKVHNKEIKLLFPDASQTFSPLFLFIVNIICKCSIFLRKRIQSCTCDTNIISQIYRRFDAIHKLQFLKFWVLIFFSRKYWIMHINMIEWNLVHQIKNTKIIERQINLLQNQRSLVFSNKCKNLF